MTYLCALSIAMFGFGCGYVYGRWRLLREVDRIMGHFRIGD